METLQINSYLLKKDLFQNLKIIKESLITVCNWRRTLIDGIENEIRTSQVSIEGLYSECI